MKTMLSRQFFRLIPTLSITNITPKFSRLFSSEKKEDKTQVTSPETNSDAVKTNPQFAVVSPHLTASNNRKRVNIFTIAEKYRAKIPITMVTAYDMPSALHGDYAGFDTLLVGDSVGMVQLGYDNTVPVTMDEMIHHCKVFLCVNIIGAG